MSTRTTRTALAIAATVLLAGCGGSRGDTGTAVDDASIEPRQTVSETTIVDMPDSHADVAYQCSPEGDMVYSGSVTAQGAGGDIHVVVDHPDCPQQ